MFSYLTMAVTIRIKAPMIIRTVWMKSVHMTAERPEKGNSLLRSSSRARHLLR
jgi:hypothetical protein